MTLEQLWEQNEALDIEARPLYHRLTEINAQRTKNCEQIRQLQHKELEARKTAHLKEKGMV